VFFHTFAETWHRHVSRLAPQKSLPRRSSFTPGGSPDA
jgi:hypothetical protein